MRNYTHKTQLNIQIKRVTCAPRLETGSTWPQCAHNHPDINEYYTVRHNAAGKELTKGIISGKLWRWLTITSFGRTDGLGDP